MRNAALLIVAAALAAPVHSRDIARTYDLIRQGQSLSATAAAALEHRLAKKPKDEEARIQLLAYYAGPPAEPDLKAVKAARASHVLWLVENDPKEGLGLFQISTGVYRVNCVGDGLADAETYRQVADLWVRQATKRPRDADIRRNAVDALQFCSPERAQELLMEARDHPGLGRLYATSVLGITGLAYSSSDPAGSDASFRRRPFAETARQALANPGHPDQIVAAANTLLRQGATLWADGKLDWDYTEMGSALLAKARSVAPDDFALLTVPTALPPRGVRPPLTLRVGGNVQKEKLLRQAVPRYPAEAKERRIAGTVKLTVLIGLDGKIMSLRPLQGPAELIQASVDAVRLWEYKPTLLNGKPCYVVTQIDVNFTIAAQ